MQEAVWNAFPGLLDAPELHGPGFLWAKLSMEMKNTVLTRFKRLIGIPLPDGVGLTSAFTPSSIPDAMPRYTLAPPSLSHRLY